MSRADEFYGLVIAHEVLTNASRELQHESDNDGHCETWRNETYDPKLYVCAACTVAHALQHNQRERARVLGVSLATVMVMDLGATLPRPARSAA